MKQPREKGWWLPLGHSISPSYSHISYCSCSRILIGFQSSEKPRLGSKIKYVYSPVGILLWSLHKSPLKFPQGWAVVANWIIFVSASFPSYLISPQSLFLASHFKSYIWTQPLSLALFMVKLSKKLGALISHLKSFSNTAIHHTVIIFSNGRVLSHVQDQVSHLYCQPYHLPHPSGTCIMKHPFSAFYLQCFLSIWFCSIDTLFDSRVLLSFIFTFFSPLVDPSSPQPVIYALPNIWLYSVPGHHSTSYYFLNATSDFFLYGNIKWVSVLVSLSSLTLT